MVTFPKSSRGSMEIFIVIIVVLLAFLFAGGEGFLDGAIPSEEVTPTPTPIPGSNSGAGNSWSIENISTVCGQQVSSISLGLHGTQDGYYLISVDSTAKAGFDFAPNAQNIESVTLDLPNSWGLNTKPWQVELFSGGSNHAGGTSKATKTMNATNCQ